MSQALTSIFLTLLGVAALGYVIKTTRPTLWRVCLAGIATGAFWVFGEHVIDSAHWGSEIPGAAVWFLLWALLLHDDATHEDERGPWVLALLPLIVMIVMAAVLSGLGEVGGANADGRRSLQILGLVFVCYVVALAMYWRMRKRL